MRSKKLLEQYFYHKGVYKTTRLRAGKSKKAEIEPLSRFFVYIVLKINIFDEQTLHIWYKRHSAELIQKRFKVLENGSVGRSVGPENAIAVLQI